MNYVIGIDIGTQGTKAALFDENGNFQTDSFRKSNLIQPEPGITEEDPEEQVTAVCSTIQELFEKSGISPGDLAAIALDGQMAGIIGIGEDGRNVTPYDSWLDTRCAPYIRKMQKEAGNEILMKTGCAPSFNHGPKKLWWKFEHPEVYEKIRSFIQPAGYAALRLCGLPAEDAFIDNTYLHFSGFADNKNSKWDEDLCGRFDLDIKKLPKIVHSHEIVGTITGEMAKRTGCFEGTPVAAGCGDTIASFLSCGAVEKGICVNVAGTSSPFTFTVEEFLPDPEQVLACAASPVPGLWYSYAYINGGGMNLEWIRNDLMNLQGDDSFSRNLSFDDLNRMAEGITPRRDDPVFVPHLAGRVSPAQPELRGAWVGLNWKHGPGHLYRAALEGVALEYGIYLETLNGLYKDFNPVEVRITGGGGKSALWNRIKADVLGIPHIPLTIEGDAPMGMALLAGKAAGLFSDLQEAADTWVRKGQAVEPDRTMADFYKERCQSYKSLLEVLNTWGGKYGGVSDND